MIDLVAKNCLVRVGRRPAPAHAWRDHHAHEAGCAVGVRIARPLAGAPREARLAEALRIGERGAMASTQWRAALADVASVGTSARGDLRALPPRASRRVLARGATNERAAQVEQDERSNHHFAIGGGPRGIRGTCIRSHFFGEFHKILICC